MAAIQNGHVPALELVEVRPGVALRAGTANAFNAMRIAAALAGVKIIPISGYRWFSLQEAMHNNPAAYGIKKGIRVAPAGSSTHGFGRAVDLANGAGLAWTIKNGFRFGFSWPFGEDDPNHFQHDGVTAIGNPTTPSGDTMSAAEVNQIIAGISSAANVIMEKMDRDNALRDKKIDDVGSTIINMLMQHMDADRAAVIAAVGGTGEGSGELTAPDIARIAKAVNDNAAERLSS